MTNHGKLSKSVDGAFFARLTKMRMTFNENDEDLKLDNTAICFIIFKSIVGLGVFTYPYALGGAGYIYGACLSILLTYMVAYGMILLVSMASQIEKQRLGLVQIT